MAVVNALEGRVFSEFALSIPAANGSRASFSLTEGVVAHVCSDLHDSVFANNAYKHRFRARDPAVVDRTIQSAMTDAYPTIMSRVGIGAPPKVTYLPWQRHTVIGYSGIMEGVGKESGHYFELRTENQLWDLDRTNRTAAHSGTIGDIVLKIAQQAGLERTVIEPTTGVGTYYQSGQGDAEFIRHRLLYRAVNSKGHGNYQFFIRDNALHFHTPEYQAELKEFAFYASSGQLLTVVDNSQKLIDAGVSGCRLVGYDPLTGRATEALSNPGIATKYADSVYKMDNLASSQRVVACHVGSNREGEPRALMQSYYESARMATFELSFNVASTLHLRAGDIVNILVNPDGLRVSSWSGYYYVTGTSAVVNNGTIDVRVTMRRGETRKIKTDVAVVGLGSSSFAGEHEAPGQPLNVKALQLSEQAQKKAYAGTTHTPVKNPSN